MKQSTHIRNLIIITVVAGAIGGIGNYFMLDVKSKTSILKPVILGIIAAGVLPLFLKLVSSNILDFVEENLRYKNYINFLSLCLLASLFADVFLQGIYAKVFHEFTEEIEQIDTKINIANEKASEATEKADFILTDIKLNNSKQTTVSTPEKNKQIKSLMKEHKLDYKEAKIFHDISAKKLVSPNQLYKANNKTNVDSTLKKLKKKNLIKEFDVNKSKMFVPKTKDLKLKSN